MLFRGPCLLLCGPYYTVTIVLYNQSASEVHPSIVRAYNLDPASLESYYTKRGRTVEDWAVSSTWSSGMESNGSLGGS